MVQLLEVLVIDHSVVDLDQAVRIVHQFRLGNRMSRVDVDVRDFTIIAVAFALEVVIRARHVLKRG